MMSENFIKRTTRARSCHLGTRADHLRQTRQSALGVFLLRLSRLFMHRFLISSQLITACAMSANRQVYRNDTLERGQNVHPEMHSELQTMYSQIRDDDRAAQFDRHVAKYAWKSHENPWDHPLWVAPSEMTIIATSVLAMIYDVGLDDDTKWTRRYDGHLNHLRENDLPTTLHAIFRDDTHQQVEGTDFSKIVDQVGGMPNGTAAVDAGVGTDYLWSGINWPQSMGPAKRKALELMWSKFSQEDKVWFKRILPLLECNLNGREKHISRFVNATPKTAQHKPVMAAVNRVVYGDDACLPSKSKIDEWIDENKATMVARGLPMAYVPEDDEQRPASNNDNTRAGEKRPGEENDDAESAKRRKLEEILAVARFNNHELVQSGACMFGKLLLGNSQRMALHTQEHALWDVSFLCDNTGEPVLHETHGSLLEKYETPLWMDTKGARTKLDRTQIIALGLACEELKPLIIRTIDEYTELERQETEELIEGVKREERKTHQSVRTAIEANMKKQAEKDQERAMQQLEEYKQSNERHLQAISDAAKDKEGMQKSLHDAAKQKEEMQNRLDDATEKIKELQKTLHDAVQNIKTSQQMFQDTRDEKTALQD